MKGLSASKKGHPPESPARARALFSICVTAILSGLMVFLPAGQSSADDRALFQAANAKPYVFFILDISGSMADTLNRTNPPMSGEDPGSKLYLAKRAAYEVIQGVGDAVNYGWATFNRERMIIYRKHWLYQTLEEPDFFDTIPLFPEGRAVVFGSPRHRQTGQVGDSGGNNFTQIDETNKIFTHRRCNSPTSVEDKILDFPKLGPEGDYTTVIYYEYGGEDYKVTMLPLQAPNKVGDMQFQARVRIEERIGNCNREDDENIYAPRFEETLTFARFYEDDGDEDDALPFADFTDYISIGRSGNDTSPFNMDDYRGTSACSAANLANPADPDNGRSHRWDGNFDGDLEFGDVITYDVTADPLNRGRELARGDMIPWDWNTDVYPTSNREEIILRLAPNLSQGETIPDFRVARYFKDVPDGPTNRQRLQLKDDYVDRPPIVSFGGTPIAGSMISFKGWYDDWAGPATDSDTGDPAFPCREKYLILLTDGAETCESGSLGDSNSPRRRLPRETAAELYDRGIRTFAVAFGTTASESASLTDIADEGGTGAGVDANNDGVFESPGRDKDGDGKPDGPGPITAANKSELVTALKAVLQLVQPEATSISAAAVPSVQADVADKIYLTEFTPIDSGSVWPGSLQSFVKPLPVSDEGLPDTSKKCSPSLTTSCLAWDAQEVIVDTQVKGSESDPIGFAADKRRIFYSKFRADDGNTQEAPSETVPRQRRFLENVSIPLSGTVPPKAYDLWRGLGIDFTANDTGSETDAADLAQRVTEELVKLRTATLPDGTKPEFVIGDFFHSDPLVVNAPSNTSYFVQDLGGDPAVTCEDGDPKSYRCFALFHQFRRKMLFIGSNAGMLHAIDAGNYRLPPSPELVDLGEFDNGTGRELFAYVPRPVMPTLVEMMIDQPSQHKFTVDGPPVAADVFIDTAHGGMDSMTDAPKAADREWRTVLMGGLRRGGSQMGDRAYNFGDILDPDVVKPDPSNPQADTDLQPASGYYLLDITQPDLVVTSLMNDRNDRDGDGLVDIWVPEVVTPENSPVCMGGADADGSPASIPSGCGNTAFGTPIWEFLDLMIDGETALGKVMPPLRLDEDNNGFIDLGFSWSKPVIGRLRVCTGLQCDPTDPDQIASGDQEDRYVAVFGGGIDPNHPNARGNWIYMVDLETGTTLYKQPVLGSVPASPAVIPTQDGYIDRIYFGTTEGYLYRLDMRPVGLNGKEILPRLTDQILTETAVDPDDVLGPVELITKTVTRIVPELRPDEGSGSNVFTFQPQILFNVNEDNPLERRSIYMSPSVFFVADLGELGIAFGTGNREDLFAEVKTPNPNDVPRPERFVVFVDDTDDIDLRSPTFTVRDVDDLQFASGSFLGRNLLTDEAEGQRGWYLEMNAEERLIGDPLVISGVLFFSTFQPNTPDFVGSGNTVLCEESGLSRVYGTLVSNAEGILADESGTATRNIEVSGLVTAPFAEQAQTKNPADPDATDDDNGLPPQLKRLMEELKKLFPNNCTFPPGHRLDIKVRNQNTGLTFVVPVPICVVETAFREL